MDYLANLQDLALFVEIARLGSFQLASANAGIPPATCSRRIAALEKRLGAQLLTRNARKLELTAAGQQYLELWLPIMNDAQAAHKTLRKNSDELAGELHVTMPVDLGLSLVGPLLPGFCDQYPDVQFRLDLSSRHVDLVRENFDVAFRIGPIHDDSLVSRRIGDVAFATYASPAYLEKRGSPQHPDDLANHDCLCISTGMRPGPWRFRQGRRDINVTINCRFQINNIGLLLALTTQGLGIALLPEPLAADGVKAGRLIPILQKFVPPAIPIQAVMPHRLQRKLVRTFLGYVEDHFAWQAIPVPS